MNKKVMSILISLIIILPARQMLFATGQVQPKDQKSKSYWTKVGLYTAAAVTAAAAAITGGAVGYQQYQGKKRTEALEKEYQQETGGFSLNSRDYEGNTPLLRAVQQGKSDLVKLMLDRGANTNAGNDKGSTPLIVLLQSLLDPSDIRTITKLLIEHDANPCLKNNNDDDAVAFANALPDEKLKKDILNELRRNTAHCDVDASLRNAVHALETMPEELTEEQKKLNELQQKISKRYNVDVTRGIDNFAGSNYTPLMYFVFRADVEVVKLVLEAGADPNIKNKESGNTALMTAIWDLNFHQMMGPNQETLKSYLKIIKLLIQHGADPCIKNINNLDAVDYGKELAENKEAILNVLKQNGTGCVIAE